MLNKYIYRTCTSTSLYVVPDVVINKARGVRTITLVSTQQQTQSVCITKANCVGESGALFCANYKKYRNTVWSVTYSV